MTRSTPAQTRAFAYAISAPAIPPAAPAHGMKEMSTPVCSLMSAATLSMRSSSNSTCSGDAPFCGANTLAAPCGPRKGAFTSHNNSTSHFERTSGRPGTDIIPMPPSHVAVPPNPIMKCLHPLLQASIISSPTPRLDASSGLRSAMDNNCNPHASATSMIAVSPLMPYLAPTRLPSGSLTYTVSMCAPKGPANTSSVPSPPSARGIAITSALGYSSSMAPDIARATCQADRHSLKESGATTIFMKAKVRYFFHTPKPGDTRFWPFLRVEWLKRATRYAFWGIFA